MHRRHKPAIIHIFRIWRRPDQVIFSLNHKHRPVQLERFQQMNHFHHIPKCINHSNSKTIMCNIKIKMVPHTQTCRRLNGIQSLVSVIQINIFRTQWLASIIHQMNMMIHYRLDTIQINHIDHGADLKWPIEIHMLTSQRKVWSLFLYKTKHSHTHFFVNWKETFGKRTT